jgi:hypothetical protein
MFIAFRKNVELVLSARVTELVNVILQEVIREDKA